MNVVEIRDLTFRYSEKNSEILKKIDLTLNEGEIVALVGRSGSGKSTLCRCICGIIPHVYRGDLKGSVIIHGQDIKKMTLPEIATKVGIVFQNPDTQLFSPTVEDELAFGPENLCVSRDEIGSRIDEALHMVNMTGYRYSNPNTLSGGQKQLIAIASVLTLQPSVLICDEIMSQIDKAGKMQIKKVLLSLKEAGRTIFIIDHDFNNLDIADKIIMIKDGKISDFNGEIL